MGAYRPIPRTGCGKIDSQSLLLSDAQSDCFVWLVLMC